MRSHTLQVGKQLADAAAEKPPAAAAAITISLDSTFIRSCEDGERHLEVRVGNVETVDGGRQVFGAVARAETDITALIQRTLETVGRSDTTEVTAFTDGCPGLRAVLANAGVTKPPILDWFHIAMRLQHTKLAAANLSTDDPDRVTAKATIVAEVERLHWRIWNGKAKNAQRSIKRIRKVMHVFKGEHSQGAKGVASRKLWHALHAIDKYLRGQAAWLVNYAKRYRAGLRVGTSITEGTANFLVNRRMNKSQQMRWSRNGADLLLQVRCAVYTERSVPGLGIDLTGSPMPTGLCQSGMIPPILDSPLCLHAQPAAHITLGFAGSRGEDLRAARRRASGQDSGGGWAMVHRRLVKPRLAQHDLEQ